MTSLPVSVSQMWGSSSCPVVTMRPPAGGEHGCSRGLDLVEAGELASGLGVEEADEAVAREREQAPVVRAEGGGTDGARMCEPMDEQPVPVFQTFAVSFVPVLTDDGGRRSNRRRTGLLRHGRSSEGACRSPGRPAARGRRSTECDGLTIRSQRGARDPAAGVERPPKRPGRLSKTRTTPSRVAVMTEAPLVAVAAERAADSRSSRRRGSSNHLATAPRQDVRSRERRRPSRRTGSTGARGSSSSARAPTAAPARDRSPGAPAPRQTARVPAQRSRRAPHGRRTRARGRTRLPGRSRLGDGSRSRRSSDGGLLVGTVALGARRRWLARAPAASRSPLPGRSPRACSVAARACSSASLAASASRSAPARAVERRNCRRCDFFRRRSRERRLPLGGGFRRLRCRRLLLCVLALGERPDRKTGGRSRRRPGPWWRSGRVVVADVATRLRSRSRTRSVSCRRRQSSTSAASTSWKIS